RVANTKGAELVCEPLAAGDGDVVACRQAAKISPEWLEDAVDQPSRRNAVEEGLRIDRHRVLVEDEALERVAFPPTNEPAAGPGRGALYDVGALLVEELVYLLFVVEHV